MQSNPISGHGPKWTRALRVFGSIVAAANVVKLVDYVLPIGPGSGPITEPLLLIAFGLSIVYAMKMIQPDRVVKSKESGESYFND